MNARSLIPAAPAVICLAGGPLWSQYANLSLDLKVTLFVSDQGRNFYPAPREGEVGIVFVKGTPGDSYNEENLGRLFNLSKVRTAGEAEMDVLWPGEEIPNSRIAHALRLNGRDFLLVLFPDKVNFKENIYTFKAEVYDLNPEAEPGSKRFCGEIVDLNAFGMVGFFFKDKTYFLTVNLLRSGWGASIPRPPVFMGPTSDKKYN